MITEIKSSINNLCKMVIGYALDHGLPTDNISLFANPRLINACKLGKSITIDSVTVSVVATVHIPEKRLENGQFRTDVYIGDSNWGIK